MKTLPFLRPLAFAGLLLFTLPSCDTGTRAGDTNVEDGDAKNKNPDNMDPNGDAANGPIKDGIGAQDDADTTQGRTGQQDFDRAEDARDADSNGMEDKK
ncbi:hypothetical protein LJY25_17685 [Hymenobacter sp. BT175]|uniref:hypothetical protein n=1 Tax=Hymenobacter translucens TaxID=2886507 RepID=UPI001D0F20D2|nr:hypothetical protein [Hymenobacter translucens]MCC2548285.1 hypothetical protein [Hymenobacter translucens]